MKITALDVALNGEHIYTIGEEAWASMEVRISGRNFGRITENIAKANPTVEVPSFPDVDRINLSGHAMRPDQQSHSSSGADDDSFRDLKPGDTVSITVSERIAKAKPAEAPIQNKPKKIELEPHEIKETIEFCLLRWYESGMDRLKFSRKLRDDSDEVSAALEIDEAHIDDHPLGSLTWADFISGLKQMKRDEDSNGLADSLGPITIAIGPRTDIEFCPALPPGESADDELTVNCRLADGSQDMFAARRASWIEQAIPAGGIGIEHTLGLALSPFQSQEGSALRNQFSEEGVARLQRATHYENYHRQKDLERFRYLTEKVFYELEPDDVTTATEIFVEAFDYLHGRRITRYEKLVSSLPELDQVAFKNLIASVEIREEPSNDRCHRVSALIRLSEQDTSWRTYNYKTEKGKPTREVVNASANFVSLCGKNRR